MEVLNAVDLAGGIHSEGDAIQAAVAHHTGEAARVIGLPHSPQDPVQDGLGAGGAFLQGGLLEMRVRPSGGGYSSRKPPATPAMHICSLYRWFSGKQI